MTKAKFSIMEVSPVTTHAKGHRFELAHPFKEEGLGMFVTVRGPECPEVKAFMRGKVNEQLRLEAKGNAPAVTVESLEANAIDRAIAYTVAWEGMVMNAGEQPLDFTPDNARTVYAHTFIRKQVLEAAESEGNFTPN